MLGALIGLVMLVSVLLLPFSDIIAGHGFPPNTLWDIFVSFINSMGSVQASHVSAFIDLAFVYQVAAILLVVGCLVGVYPAGSGALGVIGLSFATFGPYEVVSDYAASPAYYGMGFYILWGASIFQLVVAYWTWQGERSEKRQKEFAAMAPLKGGTAPTKSQVKVVQRTTKATSAMPKVCPTCGSADPTNAVVCRKCASPL